ncbi:MAG: hypothetical protein HQL64_02065 [Magnetococcales bacterium]|nr:hypothetical protein [Magnetococcales bacterium]
MIALQEELAKLTTRIDALTKRERIILLGIAISAIGALWDQAYLEPWIKGRSEIQTKIATAQGQLDSLNKAEIAILGRSKEDPDRENREKKHKYIGEIAAIKAQLANSMRDMVDPREMPRILEQLLRPESGLQLVMMAAEAAVPVVTKTAKPKDPAASAEGRSTDAGQGKGSEKSSGKGSDKSADKTSGKPTDKPAEKASDKSANKDPGVSASEASDESGDDVKNVSVDEAIFRHGMKIRLRGSYLDVVRYLKSLENMKWVIFWDSLEYAVNQYPDMTVTLSVYSLSLSRELIGM